MSYDCNQGWNEARNQKKTSALLPLIYYCVNGSPVAALQMRVTQFIRLVACVCARAGQDRLCFLRCCDQLLIFFAHCSQVGGVFHFPDTGCFMDVVLVVTFCVLELFLYHAYVMLTDVHVLRFYQQPKLVAVFCAICGALGQVDAASVPNANGIQFMN